ncbi:MAG: thiamine diphosphokinase [Acidimicrobiia bacterium]|nr:thiamine diphosphokinase [Acidimicrobiia bacterium]
MAVIHVFVGGDPVSPERIGGLGPADIVVAADSGADIAAAAAVTVNILVGDLDSVSRRALERTFDGETVIEAHSPDKDATDLELALDVALRSKPSEIVFVGGGGGRLDHLLGNFGVIGSPAARHVPVSWIMERETAYVVRGGKSVPTTPGQLFSLIPIGRDAHGVHVRNARWPLRDASLRVHGSVGISNVALGQEVEIKVGEGAVLAIFNQLAGSQ